MVLDSAMCFSEMKCACGTDTIIRIIAGGIIGWCGIMRRKDGGTIPIIPVLGGIGMRIRVEFAWIRKAGKQ